MALLPVKTQAADKGFPSPSLPAIYADAVLNLSPHTETIKFFLARSEPNFNDPDAYKYHAVAQVIMPMSAFLQTLVFFEQTRDVLLASKVITQEQVAMAASIFGAQPS